MNATNLLVALRNSANELLQAHGIYPVLDYGWDDAETPSAEYTGIAMWTTDAPFELDFNFWDRSSPPPNPTERDEIFHKAGEDFIGTMEIARNSLGLTRYSWEHRNPAHILDDEETFWEFRATTVLWLNVASDRIRDYFVMARFGMPTKQYKALHERNGIYARPFRMHQATEGKLVQKAAVELLPIAERLGKFRRTRNEIVHSIASRQGSNAVISLFNQRKEATKRPFIPRSSRRAIRESQGWDNVIKNLEETRQKELREAVQELQAWYLSLVRAASLVFEFEYWKRIGR
jgi:hypothetical protein